MFSICSFITVIRFNYKTRQVYTLIGGNTAILTQMVVLIIITQLKNKTKWYISTISTQVSSQYCVALLNLQISKNES